MMRRRWPWLAVGLVLLFAGAEVAFRLIAGERLLYRPHPEIEYLPQPGQSVVQRGARIETNAWGMRGPPVEREKPDGVFRLLVLGDSVVFGHTNIGQPHLATTLLATAPAKGGIKLEVLNVSAPSWGPGNLLAWIDANGLFGADTAIIVLSSHDLDDDRTFAAPDTATYPQEQPALALADWLARQLTGDGAPAPADPRSPGDARRSLPVLLERLAEAPQGACLVIHATTTERSAEAASGAAVELLEAASRAGLSVVHNRNFVDGASGYVDDIHLSVVGQAGLAEAMKSCTALAPALSN
jgi:hypothetical protein